MTDTDPIRREVRRRKQQETLVLVVTDMHYGKSTDTFDPDTVRHRMRRLTNRIARIIDLMGYGYEFDKLVVLVLGDINDGTDIYRTQSHHQAITNVEQQAEECARTVLVPFLTDLSLLLPVEVVAVVGNHGRAGFRANEAASWDTVAYRYAALRLQSNKRVTWEVEPIPPAIQVVNVRGHGILAYHGHEIRMYQSIPWYGLMQRMLRWTAAKNLPPFEVAHLGHFHSCGIWEINDFTICANGTLITSDEWAFQSLGFDSANHWWLHGVSESRPITHSWRLDLVGPEGKDEPVYFQRSSFLYPSKTTLPKSKTPEEAIVTLRETAARSKRAVGSSEST